MSSTTIVECAFCHKYFRQRTAEYNRSKKLGRKHYCTQSHANSASNINTPHVPKYSYGGGRKPDEMTPFRYFLNKIRIRVRQHTRKHVDIIDFDVIYLKYLWDKQKGICPITGWKLERPNVPLPEALRYKRASLDRIDSSKGYIKGNVQFVALIANYAKNNFPTAALFDFCQAVTNKRQKANSIDLLA